MMRPALVWATALACSTPGATDGFGGADSDEVVTVMAAVHRPGESCPPITEHELPALYWREYDVSDGHHYCGDRDFDLVDDDGRCWFFPQWCGSMPIGPDGDPYFQRNVGDPPVNVAVCAESGC